MKRRLFLALSLLIAAVLLCACGRATGSFSDSFGYGDTQQQNKQTAEDASERKVIQSATLNAATGEYESCTAAVEAELKAVGGYIESCSRGGYTDDERFATYVLRLPSDKLDGYIKKLYELSEVSSEERSSVDVTDSYVDIEARLSALRAEAAGLETLMESAKSMEDIVALRQRLSEINYEVEKYENTLREYDRKVDYSSLTLYLREKAFTRGVDKDVWTRIGDGLGDSFNDIGNSATELFVGLVIALPYLVILAIIVTAVVLIVRKASAGQRRRLIEKQKRDGDE